MLSPAALVLTALVGQGPCRVASASALPAVSTASVVSAPGDSRLRPLRTDFRPVKPGELEQEQIPAAPLVFVAYSVVWLALVAYVFVLWRRLTTVERELREVSAKLHAEAPMNFAEMPSSHFLFIPAVLLIGVVIGWILGSRAARDAYAAELKRREAKAGESSIDR